LSIAQTLEALMAKPDEKHEQARSLAEDALAEYAKGNRDKADRLADTAVDTDRAAVEEVVADLDEDAESDHSAAVEDTGKQKQ
jgi:hypothetical protein